MATALERKRAQFLAQFADAVFDQWLHAAEKERFWQNAAFLRGLLEEATAKLPKVALKAHLVRELEPAVAELAQLLETRYATFQTREKPTAERTDALLSELDVERALATADATKRRELAAVLALDDVVLGDMPADAPATVALVELYAAQLTLVTARRFEAPSELARKRGVFVQRIVDCGAQLVRKWAARGNWSCSPAAASSAELLRLRAVLQQVVSSDVVASAAATDDNSPALLAAPWSAFYSASASALFAAGDYDAAVAKAAGLLLALAVYYPIVTDDDASDSEATSDESDDDDNATRASAIRPQRMALLDAVAQATLSVRHVALAARARADAASLWLVAALTFVHTLPKPTSYNDDDEVDSNISSDGDASALCATDRRALLDCLADVYARAFADLRVDVASDWLLFETVVCVRRAAQFMRTERRQSVPAVTTAMAKLATVALPPSFWQWLAHVKRTFTTQPPAVRDVMKRFTKDKAARKTASALLSAADVTDAELVAIAANYDAYLTRSSDDAFVVAGASSTDASGNSSSSNDAAAAVATDSLFFVDNAGGNKNNKSNKSNSNKNKSNKKSSKSKSNNTSEKRSASGSSTKRVMKKAKK